MPLLLAILSAAWAGTPPPPPADPASQQLCRLGKLYKKHLVDVVVQISISIRS